MIRNEGTSYVPGQLPGSRVWAPKLPTASYSEQEAVALPELSAVPTSVMTAVRSLFEVASLDRERFSSEDWNPLAELIRTGDRVVIKPKWVHHVNMSGRGLACFVTQTPVIDAVLQYPLKARPSHAVIGNASIQACYFEARPCRRVRRLVDETLDWYEDSDWPQDAILEDMLEHILRNPQVLKSKLNCPASLE